MRGFPMTAATPEPNLPLEGERQERVEIGRNRIRQIFRFLKDFNGLRNPIRRQISEQPWVLWIHDLPKHSCVWLRGRDPGDDKSIADEDSGELLLRVRRSEIPKLPAVPSVLNGWLPSKWKDPAVSAIEPLAERQMAGPDGPQVEKFEAVEDRIR